MKILKLLWILCALSAGFVSCDNGDNGITPEKGGTGTVPQVALSFENPALSVLKNAGEVQIPIILAEAPQGIVKLTVGIKEETGTGAAEGIDFELKEKVITIEAGKTNAYITVLLLDNGKPETDRSFTLEIKNVYGYGKKAEINQTCEILIVNNAFIEFEKTKWLTYESAASREEYKSTCRIPLKITGNLREPATVEIMVSDSTAKEYQNFELKSKKITVNPGDETVYVEVVPIDDSEVNADRIFTLSFAAAEGSNLSVGKANTTCEVTLFSEERLKTISFKETAIVLEEGAKRMIEIDIDNAPMEGEEPVSAVIAQKIGGNAQMDVDYTLSGKTVTFNQGEKVKYVEITSIENDDIADRNFILELKAPVGAVIDAGRENTEVKIRTNDFPYFKSNYASNEATGDNFFPVYIPKALDHDVTIGISLKPVEGTLGTHYELVSEEVTIAAGTTEANICVKIGYTKEFEPASFMVEVTGPEQTVYSSPVTTKFTVRENNYRKFLGNYNVAYTSDSKEFATGKCTMEVTADPGHFMEYLVCKSTDFSKGRTYTQRFKFDPWKNTLVVVHKETVFPGVNFTSAGVCNIKLEWTKNRNAVIPVKIESDLQTLIWDMQGSPVEGILYKVSDDSRLNTRWFSLSSFVMNKIIQ